MTRVQIAVRRSALHAWYRMARREYPREAFGYLLGKDHVERIWIPRDLSRFNSTHEVRVRAGMPSASTGSTSTTRSTASACGSLARSIRILTMNLMVTPAGAICWTLAGQSGA